MRFHNVEELAKVLPTAGSTTESPKAATLTTGWISREPSPMVDAMGLTIYYTLRADRSKVPDFNAAVQLLEQLRSYCLEQDFDDVSDLLDYHRETDSFSEKDFDDASVGEQILFGESSKMLLWTDADTSEGPEVPPGSPRNLMATEGACFFITPRERCESAEFGLANFPSEIGGLPTATKGSWYWRSFCKTQYASLHGNDSFLEAHRGIVAVLDHAAEIGFEVEASDDNGYWESRSPEQLLGNLEKMNRTVAAVAGVFKDAIDSEEPDRLQAPILGHPKFEHLEAEGRNLIGDSGDEDST